MRFQKLKRRFRRELRQQQKQVEGLSEQAEQSIDRLLFKRFARLQRVRRFIIGWVGLFLLLIGGLVWQLQNLQSYYQTNRPVSGGIYSEGILGTVTNVNPIYATGEVDASLSRLIFASLFSYNDQNQLVGQLASSYTVSLDDDVYTVHLKPHLTWQDGQPLTAADVAYTYQTIQNPDAQSPLLASWQGIQVKVVNPLTVTFSLPSPLASFPYTLTTGILPQHILGDISPGNLRAANFNTNQPVGAGPFSWQGLQTTPSNDPTTVQEQVALLPFNKYVAGQPKLTEFIVHAYASPTQLATALQKGQVSAADGLNNESPATIKNKRIQAHSLLLTAGTYVFFKTSSGVLVDPKIRQALVMASDPAAIIDRLPYVTRPVREPLLEGQLGYNPADAQQTNNLVAAKALLDQDGWTQAGQATRTKANQPLSLNLVVADTPEYRQLCKQLASQWSALGVRLQISFESPNDYASTLQAHDYDATIYGIAIGVDPDVFVYWDSSQNDVRSARLNLSEYSNPAADAALEAGRTRLDPALRIIKYQPFLQSWQQDAPALGLYQPRSLYLTNEPVYGLTNHAINNSTDRYDNVQNWEIRTAKVTD